MGHNKLCNFFSNKTVLLKFYYFLFIFSYFLFDLRLYLHSSQSSLSIKNFVLNWFFLSSTCNSFSLQFIHFKHESWRCARGDKGRKFFFNCQLKLCKYIHFFCVALKTVREVFVFCIAKYLVGSLWNLYFWSCLSSMRLW